MKPATVAPRPRPKLPATRRSAVDAARCSTGTRVKVRTWLAVPTNPKRAPPMAENTNPSQDRKTKDRSRQVGAPKCEYARERPAHFTVVVLHQLISDSRLCRGQRHRDAAKRTGGPFPPDLVSLTL